MPGPSRPGPTGISGRPIGVTGISGISGRPPGSTGISGRPSGFSGGIGGFSGRGGLETTWHCGRCGRQLASGPNPPAQMTCPVCRTTNVAPGSGLPRTPGPTFRPVQPPSVRPPHTPETPEARAPLPPVAVDPQVGNMPFMEAERPGIPPDVYVPPANASRSNERPSPIKWILIAFSMLILLGVAIGGVILVIVKQNTKPAVRRRPRRYDDDDY